MIIIVGVAGAGKSVQGELLSHTLNCEWLGLGNLLRSRIDDDRRQKMMAGELLDDRDTLGILEKELDSLSASEKEFILDGCPRSLVQAQWLIDRIISKQIKFTSIIHIVADKSLAKGRLLKRGRPDDNEPAIAERFKEYDETIKPIIELFNSSGYKVHNIDGTGTVDDVHSRIMQAIR